jgi:glycosyltransferase involved in cell wall biosynthesis
MSGDRDEPVTRGAAPGGPAQPLRVLMVSATYPPTRCGVGEYVSRLAAELVTLGAQVFVLSGRAAGPQHQHELLSPETGIGPPPALQSAEPPVFTPDPAGVLLARAVERWSWDALPLVAATLRAVRPHVLNVQYHAEDYALHPAVCELAALAAPLGVPAVTTFHNLQEPHAWPGVAAPLVRLARGSARCIATNTQDQQRLQQRFHLGERVRTIEAGPGISAPAAPRRARGAGPLQLFYFGFLNPAKGLESLLRALALLRGQGRAAHLTLAAGLHTDAPGRLRAYAERVEAEIETLRLAPLLTRPGYLPHEQVSEGLLACDLAVFPFREGLCGKNTSFWSALHHAAPALTTTGPGLPAGLADLDNVLLASAEDPASLAARIAWAIEHRELLPGIGERGRAYVRARLSWDALARAAMGVLAEAATPVQEGAGA